MNYASLLRWQDVQIVFLLQFNNSQERTLPSWPNVKAATGDFEYQPFIKLNSSIIRNSPHPPGLDRCDFLKNLLEWT